jgi:hypothetical protein
MKNDKIKMYYLQSSHRKEGFRRMGNTERLNVIVFPFDEEHHWTILDWVGRGLHPNYALVVREVPDTEEGSEEGTVVLTGTHCEIVAASEKIARKLKESFAIFGGGIQIDDCPTIPSSQWGGHGLKVNTSAEQFCERLKRLCYCQVIKLTPTWVEDINVEVDPAG